MLSALPLKADSRRTSLEVRFVPISEVAAPVRSQLAMFDAPFGDLLLDGATQCSANSPSSRRHHHSRLHLTAAHLTRHRRHHRHHTHMGGEEFVGHLLLFAGYSDSPTSQSRKLRARLGLRALRCGQSAPSLPTSERKLAPIRRARGLSCDRRSMDLDPRFCRVFLDRFGSR